MRRLFTWLPYVGLCLLGVAALVRTFRSEGLDLAEFPRPPRVEFVDEVLASGTESIGGRVLDAAGSPIAEALVMADLDGELVWDYADAQGAFELERLPAGEVRLSALARKYATRVWTVHAPAGELVVDLGAPVDPPPSLPVIGESDLEGQVIAAIAGRGLLGYEVQLVPVLPPQTFGAPTPVRTEVGADRTFRFEALLHGEYRVLILPPWAQGGSWPNLVEPAQERFTHGPAVQRVTFAIQAGEIAGRLVDSRGEFVEGALIRVAAEQHPARPWLPLLSDATGHFLVRDLPPGVYRLEVAAGEARLDERVRVLGGVTSEVDLDPLVLRAPR